MVTTLSRPAPARTGNSHGLGLLVPVVGGHSRAGTSGVALALADAAADFGLRVLLIDTAEPARSGLTEIWTQLLPSDERDGAPAAVGSARRGPIVGRRLLAPSGPSELPKLDDWVTQTFSERHGPFDLTIVDVAGDAWSAFAVGHPGSLTWLCAPRNDGLALLVARATVPSLRLAAGVATRWQAARIHGLVTTQPRLVLADTASIAVQVRAAAELPVRPMLATADLLPHDPGASVHGWTPHPTPVASRHAAHRVLAQAPGRIGSHLSFDSPVYRPHLSGPSPKET